MKPIILNNITAMTAADVEKSLPVAINLVEYSSNLGNEKSTLECLRNDDDHNKGTLGNMFLSYSIDCKHGIIERKEGVDELKFKYIEDKITSMKCPTFSRRFLVDNFFIYEIPDYSRQAMTPGFSDMVVVIYTTEGRKVPQRYIGMIKSYTQAMCYVLVDKSIQKLDSFKTFEEDDHKAKTFEIRIKQNAETDPEIDDTQVLTIINDHQDYDMLYSYTDGSYVYDENDVFLDGEAFREETSPARLNAQALYPNNRIKDYFKQILLIDYDKESHNNTLMRANEIPYEYITDGTINPGYDLNLMKVYSAQRIPEFLDTDEVDSSSTEKIFKITAPVQNEYEENFEVFDSMTGRLLIPHVDFEYEYKYSANESDNILQISGIKIKPRDGRNNNISAIEILPYYDTHRRIRLYGLFTGDTVPTEKAAVRGALTKFLNSNCVDANIDEQTLRMYSSSGMLLDALIEHDVIGINHTPHKETYLAYFVLSDFEHSVAFPTSNNKVVGGDGGFVLYYNTQTNPIDSSEINPNLRGTVKEYNCFSLYPGYVSDKKLCDNMEIYSDDVGNNLHIKHETVSKTDASTSNTTELTVYNLESNNQNVKYSASNYANDVVELKANIAKARRDLNAKISYICNELCKRLSLLADKDKAFASAGGTLAPDPNDSSAKSEIELKDVNCAFICVKLTDWSSSSIQEPNAVCWEKIDDSFSDTDFITITPQNGWYILPFLKGYCKIIFKYPINATYYFYDGGFKNE